MDNTAHDKAPALSNADFDPVTFWMKVGQIRAYRTAALTVREMVRTYGMPTAAQWEIIASGMEEKAKQLDRETDIAAQLDREKNG